MIGNKLKILTFPSDGSAKTINVSKGYGNVTTNKIEGIVKTFIIMPPPKTGTGILSYDGVTIDINIS